MKIRSGFVSNSSSSSFIIAGIQVKEKDISDELMEELENNFSIQMGGEDGAPEGSMYIGTGIGNPDEYGQMDEAQWSIKEISDCIEEAKAALPVGTKIQKEGVFIGTYMC